MCNRELFKNFILKGVSYTCVNKYTCTLYVIRSWALLLSSITIVQVHKLHYAGTM